MSWWMWVLIWVVLVVAAIAVLVLFALSFWRKGTAVMRQLDDLLASLERIAEAAEPEAEERPRSALFADRATVSRRHGDRAERRRDARAARRDERVRRGKLLVHRNPLAK